MKIFIEGLGEVEVCAGGLDPEWQQRFLEDGYDGDAEEDDARKCPHCGQTIA